MKIHEKLLLQYQSCCSPVDREGFLYKKGERTSSYQRRWFVLKGNLLFYRERRTEPEPQGVLVLEGCSIQLAPSEDHHAFSLVWAGPGLRTYKLAARDQDDQEAWIRALLAASHGYLALLVRDLERQYQELLPFSSHQSPSSIMQSHTGSPGSSAHFVMSTASSMFCSNQALQAPPSGSDPSTVNAPPINTRAPPPGAGLDSHEEFVDLHQEFGQEVKELLSDWLKGRCREEQEVNLIDLG